MLRFYHDLLSFFLLMWFNFRVLEVLSVYVHVRCLASNIADKLGNAYLRYQYRQPATCFPWTETVAMLAIPVLPVKWKARLVASSYLVCRRGGISDETTKTEVPCHRKFGTIIDPLLITQGQRTNADFYCIFAAMVS